MPNALIVFDEASFSLELQYGCQYALGLIFLADKTNVCISVTNIIDAIFKTGHKVVHISSPSICIVLPFEALFQVSFWL